MKDYIKEFLRTLSPTQLMGHFYPKAVLLTIIILVVGHDKLFSLLQNNDFGFWGDTAIVGIAVIGISLLSWVKLLFYYCLWALFVVYLLWVAP